MNEHAYFHWDLLRQPLQTPQFGMGAPFFDVNSILELRKEKSRDAARSRRGKENYEFYELAKLLPLPAAITSQLDKASIIRLTISYLKLRDFSSHGDPPWTQEGGQPLAKITKGHPSRLDLMDPFESRQGTHILQSLDGFAFILANDGRFLYISETVSIYLGLSQVEMAGSSIFDYVHPQDHTELADHLGMCLVAKRAVSPQGSGSDEASSPATPRPGSPSPTEKGYMMVQGPDTNPHKSFSLRMKSTLTKRGVHVKTSGYRVVHILGSLRPQSTFGTSRNNGVTSGSSTTSNSSSSGCNNTANSGNASNGDSPLLGLVGMAIALPPPTVTELRLEVDTFITRLSPDFKVIYCEPIITDLMDLSVDDVTDRLLYDLCHVADLKNLRRSHLDILNKGQALTDYYRLINRHGGYVWVQTCATTLLNNKNSEDQSILAINYVVSGAQSKACAVDLWQVSGDVNSAMSSASDSRCREEKLKELKASKLVVGSVPKSKSSVGNSNGNSVSANGAPRTASDRLEPSTTELKSDSQSTSPKGVMDHAGEDGGALSPGKSSAGLDGKNKRRKMENPRKRKRSSSDPPDMDVEKALNLTRGVTSNTVIITDSQCHQKVDKHKCGGQTNSSSALATDLVSSSSPEDLSMKTSLRKSPDRNIIRHSSNVFRSPTPPLDSVGPKSSAVLDVAISHSAPSPVSLAGSSVKELEAAMNRHLPAHSNSTDYMPQNDRTSLESILTADSSTIGKGFSSITGAGIGSNPPPSSSPWLHSPRNSSGPDMLTASNFLRSLYANRESVIKTSTRPQAPFLNSEPPTSLLTPPEPDPMSYREHSHAYAYGRTDPLAHSQIYDKDSYEGRDHMYKDQTHRDQYSFIPYKDHIPSAYIDHLSSSVYKDHIASTYKDLSPYKDIIPTFTIPSLMSPTGRVHQPYPSLHHHFSAPITSATMDACSITPPSSNSPDLSKHSQPPPPAPTQHFDTAGFSADMTANNTCNLSQKSVMNSSLVSASSSPTSNHLYQGPRHHKDHQLYQGVTNTDLSKSGFYGVGTASPGSVYMDLNQAAPVTGQYETCTRPVLPWF